MSDWLQQVPSDYDRDLGLEADVCVIGSGAGGAVLAAELAEAGHRVVLLEKGAHHTRRDFNQQESDMMPRLFEDGGARTTRDGGMMILHARTVGGSTAVNWAICFDPPAQVLDEWADRHGVEHIRLEDMAPHLKRVRHVLNVQPLPETQVNRNGRLLLVGARKLGMKGGVFEHSRTGCVGSGFCILGCSYDRKQSMLVTYVPRAQAFGARLVPSAEVTGFEEDGHHVTAAIGTVTNPETGRRFALRVKAKLFCVAGGAISTPQLLLKAGVRDPSGRLGENLTLHPTSAAIGLFDEPVRGHEGIHFSTYVSDLEPEGIIIESVFAYPGLMSAAGRMWGERGAEVMAKYDHMAAAIVLLHDDGRGRVSLGADGAPVIDYWVNERDQAKFKRGLAALARIYFAAGAREVIVPYAGGMHLRGPEEVGRLEGMRIEPNRFAAFSAHQMGTAAMGADPFRSVTDSYGRLHSYRNLFVCDGSLMPSSIGVNPQITIAALADRTARHINTHADRYMR